MAAIAMLRERRSGTLERLMTLPTSKFGLLLGYAAAFGALAVAQAATALSVAVLTLDLDVAGPLWLAVVVAVANALLGMSMGLFFSAFAQTEFQAIQFMPAFISVVSFDRVPPGADSSSRHTTGETYETNCYWRDRGGGSHHGPWS